MKKSIILILIFFGLTSSYSQSNADSIALEFPEIKVIGRAQSNKILLRWAPTTPIAWKQLNTYGYTIERYTISRDKSTLLEPEKKVLTQNILLPEPLEQWMSIIEANDNAAIVAQALYGEDFSVTMNNDVESIVAMSEDLQQRYTFTLFTADQDFDIAKKAALGFEDTTVKANEKYVYRVISNVPSAIKDIKYGGVFVGITDFESLPKPLDLVSDYKDANVILSWNFKIFETTYNNYNIERSSGNDEFIKINPRPYTILNQSNRNGKSDRIFYIDSISNNKQYKYRVQGITTFGELGPYSEIVLGEGKSLLKEVPHLTIKNIIDENNVELTFEFPEDANKEIKGFELNRSNGEGETLEIVVKNIPPKNRTVVYDKLKASNYFTIAAVGKNGDKRTSFPMLVQPEDSIPPKKPIGLTGTVDSLGVVSLSWSKNTESDLLGYRVYRGNIEKEEFSQLTVNPQKANMFTDTITVRNLNSKVFYQVISTDIRYNMSIPSDILALKKPDFIPPSSPVFKDYEFTDEQIDLNWAKSSSEDVVKQLLYRKTNKAKEWDLILETEEPLETYTDTDITVGKMYSYTILAIDDSGLESIPSPSISIVIPKTKVNTQIKGFYAHVDKINKAVLLSWRYKEDGIAEYEIYKSKKGEKLRLLRMVPTDSKRLYDYDLKINTEYQYAIRAVFKDGRMSKLVIKKVKY
ncbi:fibronectin type III domain-containing protein [Olleya sp. Bg11-27]|uniref:fibronectin type III domain-containing protein n=1 Tax=Olleya sp. Bg11-27 TaxID=2058135 RepID=UPI000C3029EE|nr:hypothetical protein [Olleya sp. Bg11-27]AUC76146.1 hypothetical protein CW732_10915 [Olleya sp. Bg11-27]